MGRALEAGGCAADCFHRGLCPLTPLRRKRRQLKLLIPAHDA